MRHDNSEITVYERIDQLVRFDPDGRLQLVHHAAIACDREILWVGPASDLPKKFVSVPKISCEGLVALPGLIDSHTHTIFAGSRENEFELKIQGKTYAEIAASGGGIANTVRATRAASFEELLQLGVARANAALEMGITTIEMKSGYGLSLADEIKLLEVAARISQHVPIDVVSTFLGAHTVPPEFKSDRQGYVRLVCEEMLPAVAERKLAECCDVFCEQNAFSCDETRRIFESARRSGLGLKLHADQLSNTRGAELCAEMGAVSADHLENVSEAGLDALAGSGVVAGLLPGCSFYLNMKYPPARALLDRNIPVALATDFNPGSCPTQNLHLIMTIACTQMKMTPEEAVRGVTLYAARSLRRPRIGNLAIGHQADIAFFRAPSYTYIPYRFGQNHIAKVVKNGKVVVSRP